jgi:uncharacterized membrane protein
LDNLHFQENHLATEDQLLTNNIIVVCILDGFPKVDRYFSPKNSLMYSKVKIAGHPVHPMLVAFPVAFYTATLVCYIVYTSNDDPFWFRVGVVANIAGVAMAALAAIPGFIDWLYIPKDSSAKKTGFFHMVFNVIALVCFAVAAWIMCPKWNDSVPEMALAIALSAVGFILTMVAGFLGWTLVQKHHVGVDIDHPKQKL